MALEKNGATKSETRARMGRGGDSADAWAAGRYSVYERLIHSEIDYALTEGECQNGCKCWSSVSQGAFCELVESYGCTAYDLQ